MKRNLKQRYRWRREKHKELRENIGNVIKLGSTYSNVAFECAKNYKPELFVSPTNDRKNNTNIKFPIRVQNNDRFFMWLFFRFFYDGTAQLKTSSVCALVGARGREGRRLCSSVQESSNHHQQTSLASRNSTNSTVGMWRHYSTLSFTGLQYINGRR